MKFFLILSILAVMAPLALARGAQSKFRLSDLHQSASANEHGNNDIDVEFGRTEASRQMDWDNALEELEHMQLRMLNMMSYAPGSQLFSMGYAPGWSAPGSQLLSMGYGSSLVPSTSTEAANSPISSPVAADSTSQPASPTSSPATTDSTVQPASPTSSPATTDSTAQPASPTSSPVATGGTAQPASPTSSPATTDSTAQPASPTSSPAENTSQPTSCNTAGTPQSTVATTLEVEVSEGSSDFLTELTSSLVAAVAESLSVCSTSSEGRRLEEEHDASQVIAAISGSGETSIIGDAACTDITQSDDTVCHVVRVAMDVNSVDEDSLPLSRTLVGREIQLQLDDPQFHEAITQYGIRGFEVRDDSSEGPNDVGGESDGDDNGNSPRGSSLNTASTVSITVFSAVALVGVALGVRKLRKGRSADDYDDCSDFDKLCDSSTITGDAQTAQQTVFSSDQV